MQTATAGTGGDPHGLAFDSSGATLYVANLFSNDVSLVDAATMHEITRLRAGVQPFEGPHAVTTRTRNRDS